MKQRTQHSAERRTRRALTIRHVYPIYPIEHGLLLSPLRPRQAISGTGYPFDWSDLPQLPDLPYCYNCYLPLSRCICNPHGQHGLGNFIK